MSLRPPRLRPSYPADREAAVTQPATVSFPVFGVQGVVAATDESALERALPEIQATLGEFDLACSRFRPDSELSRLNRATGQSTLVGPLLFEALTQAVRAARLTGGAVDPTIGSSLIACGYDRDFELVRRGAGRVSFRRVAGWQRIDLDATRRIVRVPVGVTLDLGSVAKAMAADAAAARAVAALGAGCGVLVSLGGDLAAHGDAPAGGWPVRVTDDHRAGTESPGQWISVRSGGLATSSTTARRWKAADGTQLHHLLDPASGRPAEGPWRTASVAAGTCLDANIASTAALVRGEQATAFLTDARLPSRLVGRDGRARHLCDWPQSGEEL